MTITKKKQKNFIFYKTKQAFLEMAGHREKMTLETQTFQSP